MEINEDTKSRRSLSQLVRTGAPIVIIAVSAVVASKIAARTTDALMDAVVNTALPSKKSSAAKSVK